MFKEYQVRFPGDERLQRPPRCGIRDFRVELAQNIASLPKSRSPFHILMQVGHKHPEENLKWNTAPYMWMKRGIAWCVRRGMGLGGKFTPCTVLLSVRGTTCISPRKGTVFKCSTPGSFMTPSDLITASLAKIGCMCCVWIEKLWIYLLILLTIMIRYKPFFFFKNGVCHLSGDGRGERWVPHPFFWISSELFPRWVEGKENYADLLFYNLCSIY